MSLDFQSWICMIVIICVTSLKGKCWQFVWRYNVLEMEMAQEYCNANCQSKCSFCGEKGRDIPRTLELGLYLNKSLMSFSSLHVSRNSCQIERRHQRLLTDSKWPILNSADSKCRFENFQWIECQKATLGGICIQLRNSVSQVLNKDIVEKKLFLGINTIEIVALALSMLCYVMFCRCYVL